MVPRFDAFERLSAYIDEKPLLTTVQDQKADHRPVEMLIAMADVPRRVSHMTLPISLGGSHLELP